jgi:hypothetical protein
MSTLAVPMMNAVAGENRWGNPCDIRDTCSAEPGKYVIHRDNANIKAREYVGEMRWGTGGAPDDVYVISKTVGSRDFAGAKACETRDACSAGQKSWKIVRNGPSLEAQPVAKGDGTNVANTPAQK